MRSSFLAGIFGRSPVEPLIQHMAKSAEAGRRLMVFIDAALAGDWDTAGQVRKEISRLEHEADDLKSSLRKRMPSTLLMPVDRGDLLDLIAQQDKIANRAKDIAGMMYHRRLTPPASVATLFRELAARSIDAIDQAERSVNELEELYTVGFRGAEVQLIDRMITKLSEIEDDTDRLVSELLSRVFELENELPPVSVMFLYRVIEWLGGLGDIGHRIGGLLQRLIAR